MSNEVAGPIDAIIIGAGVIGCSVALELSRHGKRTLTVDKGAAAGLGSTSSSSAVVRYSYSTESGVNIAREGLAYWQNWPDHIGFVPDSGLVGFTQRNMLLFFTEAQPHPRRVRELWSQLDVPHEVLTVADLRERFPFMSPELFGPPSLPEDDAFWRDPWGTVEGALLSPDAGYVSDPQLAAQNLHDAAIAAGATFQFGAEVTGIQRSSDRVTGVSLADGSTIEAPVVINVAGPHSRAINRLAGQADAMSISTAPMRQEVHHVPAPDGVDFERDGPILGDDDVGFYCRPELGNHVLIGGMEPECDVLEWLDDADEYNPNITDLWHTQVLRANRRFPDLGVPHQRRGIVGVYDVSDDWLPVFDRTDLGGYYVAIGSSGNQFKNAGPIGQLMTELIDAVESGHDHDRDPIAITGQFTGRKIDVGTFSRNRAINPDSPMSVHG